MLDYFIIVDQNIVNIEQKTYIISIDITLRVQINEITISLTIFETTA